MGKTEICENTKRRAGILLPVSSLPSEEGIGTLGKGAFAFVDWLHSAGMRVWQVLPLLPTGYGDSPYQSCASNALNYYFIDLETLVSDGLLEASEYRSVDWGTNARRVDYTQLFRCKISVLEKAFARFDKNEPTWLAFLEGGKYYDFAVFMALKRKNAYTPWQKWQETDRSPETLPSSFYTEYAAEIDFWQFTQYIFLKQWRALTEYAHEKGVKIMGDMPIYLSEDSVEMWKYRKELFMLDENGRLAVRAGVPPDAFSEDGQLWGNPVYDWEKMRKNGYAWWRNRIADMLQTQFDVVRIDHFRAFDRFYAVPVDADSAREGAWLDGPKAELFVGMQNLPVVAEDLGVIDDGVRALLRATGYPGMKVFQFAFDGNADNEYLPSNFRDENCVAYTGTHDNDTLRSFIESMDVATRKAFERVFEEECLAADVAYLTESVETECESAIELLFASKANTVIVPMQDVLCMGTEARLNAPATLSEANWTFRFLEKDFGRRKAAWLKNLTETYAR